MTCLCFLPPLTPPPQHASRRVDNASALRRRQASASCIRAVRSYVAEGEHRLRLLNYQHNAIAVIQRLDSVRSLVFLDLYSNQIDRISGLECVPGLRVLMLGRNRIGCIQGLSHLDRLDVLDLHNNEITSTAGLEGLKALRILNLAGNSLTSVGDMSGMKALAELNLRRNRIADLAHGGGGNSPFPPGLQRCFISHNIIESPAGLAPLGCARRLTELSADGNPMAYAAPDDASYRWGVLGAVPGLLMLDNESVTEQERVGAAAAAHRLRHASGARTGPGTGGRIRGDRNYGEGGGGREGGNGGVGDDRILLSPATGSSSPGASSPSATSFGHTRHITGVGFGGYGDTRGAPLSPGRRSHQHQSLADEAAMEPTTTAVASTTAALLKAAPRGGGGGGGRIGSIPGSIPAPAFASASDYAGSDSARIAATAVALRQAATTTTPDAAESNAPPPRTMRTGYAEFDEESRRLSVFGHTKVTVLAGAGSVVKTVYL